MYELIEVKKNGVSAYKLYKALGISSNFSTWIKRKINDYGFVQGLDFVPFREESTGGRPLDNYILSIGTAKEISMVEKNDIGRKVRRYLIDVEDEFRRQLLRDSTKLTRRNLTDVIKDSGENERMHGHAYSQYTMLIYKKLGIQYTKQKDFRSTLTPEQLKAVEGLEKLADGYLRLGYGYSQIKNAMPDFITEKQDAQLMEA